LEPYGSNEASRSTLEHLPQYPCTEGSWRSNPKGERIQDVRPDKSCKKIIAMVKRSLSDVTRRMMHMLVNHCSSHPLTNVIRIFDVTWFKFYPVTKSNPKLTMNSPYCNTQF